MTKTFKVVMLAIALMGFIFLWKLGFAIWVFLPLLPAGLIFAIIIATLWRKPSKHPAAMDHSDHADQAKAA